MSKQILSGFFDNRRLNQRDGQHRGRLAGTSARSRLTAIATGALLFGTVLCGGGVAAEEIESVYGVDFGYWPAQPDGQCKNTNFSHDSGEFQYEGWRNLGGRCYLQYSAWGGPFLPGVLMTQGYGRHDTEEIVSRVQEHLPDAKLIKGPNRGAPPYRIITKKGAVLETFVHGVGVDFVDVDCGTADHPWYRPGFRFSNEYVKELVVCPDDSKAPTLDELLERGKKLPSKPDGWEFISNKRIAVIEDRTTHCRPHPMYDACRANQSLQPVCQNRIEVARRTREEACADPRLEGEKAPAGGPE